MSNLLQLEQSLSFASFRDDFFVNQCLTQKNIYIMESVDAITEEVRFLTTLWGQYSSEEIRKIFLDVSVLAPERLPTHDKFLVTIRQATLDEVFTGLVELQDSIGLLW